MFSLAPSSQRVLLATAALHAVVAIACVALLAVPAAPIGGVHPALKPLKFGVSIAIFLLTIAALLPSLRVRAGTAGAIALTLSATMTLEMVVIAVQAARGTTSHFNLRTPLDAALWRTMVGAIVVATITMLVVALVATLRPLRETSPAMSFAWRAALWVFLLSAVSGFAMGGRLAHTVGGADGGHGLAFVNWSTRHGDLRVPHFVAMHALQVLPLVAFVLERVVASGALRATLLWSAVGGFVLLSVASLALSLAGRPLIATSRTPHEPDGGGEDLGRRSRGPACLTLSGVCPRHCLVCGAPSLGEPRHFAARRQAARARSAEERSAEEEETP